ncbi:hypothetical protein GE061_016589 [Apolygus lucorum]|uniref:Uncharacterized protein n=1 Tax=Apolygus lucorum TaxID=248454 RepID=A0A6A4K5Y0_APOLU|nr:hypothetical protein GE061_016589 [Apolygus lucorum]
MAYPEGFADESELNTAIFKAVDEVDGLYQEVTELHKSWLQTFGSCSSQDTSRNSDDFIWAALTRTSDDIEEETLYALFLDVLENEQDELRIEDLDTFDDIFLDFPEEEDEPLIEEEETAPVLPSCPTED